MQATTNSKLFYGFQRWRAYVWATTLLVVVVAVYTAAAQKSSDDATFRKLTDDYCAAWSSGHADAPAKFYAKDADLVFYDVAPFSYAGWSQYQEGVKKEFLDGAAALTLTAGKELKVHHNGTLVWTTVPMHLSTRSKSGQTTELDLRHTGIWEKRGADWVLVHEHISAAYAPPGTAG